MKPSSLSWMPWSITNSLVTTQSVYEFVISFLLQFPFFFWGVSETETPNFHSVNHNLNHPIPQCIRHLPLWLQIPPTLQFVIHPAPWDFVHPPAPLNFFNLPHHQFLSTTCTLQFFQSSTPPIFSNFCSAYLSLWTPQIWYSTPHKLVILHTMHTLKNHLWIPQLKT